MKAYEFPARVTPGGQLKLPSVLVKALPKKQTVRVIILTREPMEEEGTWKYLAEQQFLSGYDSADAIYDQIYTQRK